jgi:DNA-binding CsgD family transcriptional regulator
VKTFGTAAAGVVGRDKELAMLTRFLQEPQELPVLVLEGEAGIGKSTLWEWAVEAASTTHRVISARAVNVEARISFATVSDLLTGTLEELERELPPPQRHALEAALLLAEPGGSPPEPHAIAFAFLSALRILARHRPLVVAVDDIQWLDQPSASALVYAARRLGDAPVRVLLVQRTSGAAHGSDVDRLAGVEHLRRVALGPLSLGALQHIIRQQLDFAVPRPVLRRLHAVSGGNPFYAVEIARAIARADGRIESVGAIPMPERLRELVDARLAMLPRETELALQVAALMVDPTVEIVELALGTPPILRPAVDARIIDVTGNSIDFVHPLLASGLAARVDPGVARGLHGRIAAVADDPEERARHLAMAASGADADAASALDDAARQAQGRGAPEVAAELLERALVLTPPSTAEHVRRLLAASDAQRDAGDYARAHELAQRAVDALPPGEDRAQGLLRLARSSSRPCDACVQALSEAGANHTLRAQVGLTLATRDLSADFHESFVHARTAVADAELAGDPALLAEALALQAGFEAACCEGDPLATLGRCDELRTGGTRSPITTSPSFAVATVHMWRDELDVARAGFSSELELARRRGDFYEQIHALMHLAQVDWRGGDWAGAAEYAEEAWLEWHDSGDVPSVGAALWLRALVAAHRGALDVAMEQIAEASAVDFADRLYRPRLEWLRGFIALSQNDPEQALPHLEAAAQGFSGSHLREPGLRLFASDLVDALVATGRLDEAADESAALVDLGEELARPRALTIGHRGLGLVAAARGELDTAAVELTDSLLAADRLPVPFERGRTLLALGTVQRRALRRRDARDTLTQAVEVFEQLTSPTFAERARIELGRIGGRVPGHGELTAAEHRIAELVAEGKTNREVAAVLVVSIHTVESALTQVYRKLGLRSRAELARHFAEQRSGAEVKDGRFPGLRARSP